MIEVCAKHPPLSCRTSPPHGGRFAIATGFANLQRVRTGRTEGGGRELNLSISQQQAVAP
ncbi:MAG: hypothetical protein E5W97_02265 [Mesorhizobium sp.]|nr:MAG: hypothetical protein E5W97_02265 [Mesorhizobium sp.]